MKWFMVVMKNIEIRKKWITMFHFTCRLLYSVTDLVVLFLCM